TGANGYAIGIEHEGFSLPFTPPIPHATWTRTNPWPEPMVQSSIAVKRWLFANVPSLGEPSRDTIIGHYEIDARNRPDDPASSKDRSVWPVDRMIAALTTQEEDMQPGYTLVMPGETLTKVSERTGILVKSLVALNDIKDVNKV